MINVISQKVGHRSAKFEKKIDPESVTQPLLQIKSKNYKKIQNKQSIIEHTKDMAKKQQRIHSIKMNFVNKTVESRIILSWRIAIVELIYNIISDDFCTMRNTVLMTIAVAQEIVTGIWWSMSISNYFACERKFFLNRTAGFII